MATSEIYPILFVGSVNVYKRQVFCHPATLIARPARLNQFCSDSAKVRSPQHQMFDCGSIGLQDKVASSLQEIKFLNNGFKRFGPLFYGDSVLSYICYSKQPQH